MKVLITGASGKIGSLLVKNLSARRTHTVGICHHRQLDLHNVYYKKYICDISDLDSLEKIIIKERPDSIIHLAALTSLKRSQNVDDYYKINTKTTAGIANLACKYQLKRFIFSSTAAVYHQTKLSPTKENENINPQSDYGKSKLTAENNLRTFASKKLTKFFVFRIFNIYGEGFEDSLINKLIASSKDNNSVEIIDPDNFYRDYMNIEDVVKILISALYIDKKEFFNLINLASGYSKNTTQIINELTNKGFIPNYKTILGQNKSKSRADITALKRFLVSDDILNPIIDPVDFEAYLDSLPIW